MCIGDWNRRMGVAVLALAGYSAAQAIVTASGANPEAPSGLDLSGVGALSNGCSSVLLAGGGWLLGSAHCAAGVGATVSFSNGATASITELDFAPDWLPGQQVAVNDLSLMKLSAPPVGVVGFAVAAPSARGASIVAAGYGAGGSGLTGGTLPTGTLRFGFNQYEVVLGDSPTATYGGRVVGFDFDDGSTAFNRFGSIGLGAGEAMLASLDSGARASCSKEVSGRSPAFTLASPRSSGPLSAALASTCNPATTASGYSRSLPCPSRHRNCCCLPASR